MRSDLKDLHAFNASSQVLRDAIESGLIDWTWGEAARETIITPAILDSHERNLSPNFRSDNWGLSPSVVHFREDSRGRILHPGISAPYAEWSVELARFAVPIGDIGIIKGLEQYLAQQPDEQLPGYVYTQSARWGVPGPWHTGIANPINDSGAWHFRLRNIARRTPAWSNLVGIAAIGELPDLPYTDFPQEEEIWFPAGSSSSQNIHLIIPSGHLLRVFYRSPAQQVRLEVACKVKGFLQSSRSPETAWNVRTNW